MSRWLIVFGVVLIVAGLPWPVLQKLGLGRLPGDIVIERENFRFYFPIATSLILSIVLSILLWLLNRYGFGETPAANRKRERDVSRLGSAGHRSESSATRAGRLRRTH